MTMPEKITAWKASDNIGSTHGWNEGSGETQYIRKDLADELARALEAVDIAINATYFGPDAEKNKRKAVKGAVRTGRKALARFRA